MIWAIIIIVGVLLDQFSKLAVIRSIPLGDSVSVINHFFYLTHITNTGAAMSILRNGRWILIPFTIIVSAILVYIMTKSRSKMLKLTLSLILVGALGNLIDRIFRASVVDFLDFRFGSYNFYIFNIADCYVVVGTILLAWYMLFIQPKDAGIKEL